ESDTQLQAWKTKILAAVGDNGQVLIEVIPELEWVIGKQPIAPELSGSAAQNRFNLLFQKFIEVFTTVEHPLVMFLDDLQWADSASLQLIKLLMGDKGYLLLLGAYRDNEVSPVHPFILTVEELKKAGKTVNTITLAPLTFADTNQLVADTLHCSTQRSQPLTELIDRKTKGNPFFTTQFLKALYEDGYIRFNHVSSPVAKEVGWECDITQIHALSLTDDVVEFMAQQLQKLPSQTQQVLKLAACIGNQFDLATLAIVSEKSEADTAAALWKALQEGLILPQTEVYKFYLTHDEINVNTEKIENVAYRFLHDRVQQAAYSLIPEVEKQSTHLKIGRLLLQNTPTDQQEEGIFAIINQLNYGVELIAEPNERKHLSRLNLIAGCKAKNSTAYGAAVEYFKVAMDLLPINSWQSSYDLTLAIYESAAEAEYLNTNFESSKSLVDILLKNAKSPLEKVRTYEIQIQSYTAQNKFLEAIATGKEALQLLDLTLPEDSNNQMIFAEHQQLQQLLMNQSIAALADMPE
ncbi:MAG: histidine kinase, partial [Mastigocladus sp. ERB_26_1]